MNIKEILYNNLPTMTLEEFNNYKNEADNGYITIREHPEDSNLVILNYTELTTYERRWNKYTMSARGLILDLTDVNNNGKIYILAKPFGKFFNYGENKDYEKDIDFSDIESVTEKMDGSLGISYFFNEEIRFATRGSFNSEQAIRATEIWKEKYADKFNWLGYMTFPYTMLTEIIYPENRVVVDYKGMEDLVMLGIINLSIAKDEPISVVKSLASNLGMPVTKEYKYDLHKLLEMKKTISANKEGWIIKFGNGKRLKIKGDEYLKVHRAVYGLSDKAKVSAWVEDNIDELIKSIPEEFREEIENLKKGLDNQLEVIKRILSAIYMNIKEYTNASKENRKDFAKMVNQVINPEYRKFMFIMLNNNDNLPDKIVKEYIFKNYEHYLGEIRTWIDNDF